MLHNDTTLGLQLTYGSLDPRGQRLWVKGQIFQNASIELKIVRNDRFDLLSMLKIQLRSLTVI